MLMTSVLPVANAGGSFTDAAGDVAIPGPSGGSPLAPNPQTDAVDLVGLDVAEADNDFTFNLKVKSLQQQGGTFARYGIDMTWTDATFRILLTRSRIDPSAQPLHSAGFYQISDGDASKITDLEVSADDASGTFSIRLPKVNIISLQGHAPVYGSQLTGVKVTSTMPLGFMAAPASATDAMPDDAPGVITYETGGSANGHLVLEAPDPVRISNGGATTFVFQGHLQNRGDSDDAATLSLENVPEAWKASTITLQQVPPGEERPVFVVVTIPFGHEHGGFSNFTLTATSTKSPDIKARIKYGVLHTPVPMPAGHHSELYLHAVSGDTGAFGTAFGGTTNSMNTVADKAPDEVEYASPRGAPQGGPIKWSIPLGPQLAMGLDADINRTGEIAGSILGRASGEATLTGEVVLVKGDQEIARLFTSAPALVTLDLQNPTAFTMPLTPTVDSDYVPYAPGQNIVLRVTMESTAPVPCCASSEQAPGLSTTDFKMTLPLNEYADTPQWDPGVASTVSLQAQGELIREGRPGTTLTYQFTLTNNANARDEIDLGLAGTHADAATLAPTQTVQLEPKESRIMTLAVLIPQQAENDQRFEVLLIARSQGDPSNIAIGRTTTIVKRGAATSDESGILADAQNEGKDTPLPGTVLSLIALAGIAAATTRRRTR